MGVYQAAKDVSASYDAVLDLFEVIEGFLGRLEIYANIPSSEAIKDTLAKVMIEIISTLALATKQIKQGRLSETRPC